MWVKWHRRDRVRGGDLWTAALIQSRRVDGIPRQKAIAYLGSIRAGQVRNGQQRVEFWSKASATLDRLGVDHEKRCEIEAALAKRVPKPTAKTVRKYGTA